MRAPSVTVLLVSGYSAVLLVVAWLFDRMGARSAERSARWRTGNFIYHEDQDAWKCHQDQWLWPASFDPDKRVIRYEGQHAICGRCPVKDDCSPTPGPRELTRQLDPWPHSEAGRFHRGLSLVVAAVAVFMPTAMLLGAHGPGDVIVLVTTVLVGLIAGAPLAQHLWRTPSNFPEHLRQDASSDAPGLPELAPETAGAAKIDQILDRYQTRWASDRRRVDLPDPKTRK
ncbi:hypothetical protein [Intrasporangium sp. DVR]|uniref:hypothetical protein n=1 Tax=Intrasporangium sp. DVR TaxID=3127867 RepID=UPI00313A5C45